MSRSPSKNCLKLLSAGKGRRMGGQTPKTLIKILGRPMLHWTLKNADACKFISCLILAVPVNAMAEYEGLVKRWKLRKQILFAEGGKERADSTRNALALLPPGCSWVGIHDAARPFCTPDLTEACFKGALETGAAILAVPSKDTIKLARGNYIKTTAPRSLCWCAQTPQVFRRDLAEKIRRFRGSMPTDEASILESLGHKVKIVPGSYKNIKITTPEDIALAETILRRGNR